MDGESMEQQKRERAYHFWVAEGRPHGRHEEHWKAATIELEASERKSQAVPKRRATRKPRPASVKLTAKGSATETPT